VSAFAKMPYAHLRKSPALRAAPFGKGGFRAEVWTLLLEGRVVTRKDS
jgi:hypothetical protein